MLTFSSILGHEMASVYEKQIDWNSQSQFAQDFMIDNDHESDEDYEVGASQLPLSKRRLKKQLKGTKIRGLDCGDLTTSSSIRSGKAKVPKKAPFDSKFQQISYPLKHSNSKPLDGITKVDQLDQSETPTSGLKRRKSPGLKRGHTPTSTSSLKACRTITQLFSRQSNSAEPSTLTSSPNDRDLNYDLKGKSNVNVFKITSPFSPEDLHHTPPDSKSKDISSVTTSKIAINSTPIRHPKFEVPSSSPRVFPLKSKDQTLNDLILNIKEETKYRYQNLFRIPVKPISTNLEYSSKNSSVSEIPCTVDPFLTLSQLNCGGPLSESLQKIIKPSHPLSNPMNQKTTPVSVQKTISNNIPSIIVTIKRDVLPSSFGKPPHNRSGSRTDEFFCQQKSTAVWNENMLQSISEEADKGLKTPQFVVKLSVGKQLSNKLSSNLSPSLPNINSHHSVISSSIPKIKQENIENVSDCFLPYEKLPFISTNASNASNAVIKQEEDSGCERENLGDLNIQRTKSIRSETRSILSESKSMTTGNEINNNNIEIAKTGSYLEPRSLSEFLPQVHEYPQNSVEVMGSTNFELDSNNCEMDNHNDSLVVRDPNDHESRTLSAFFNSGGSEDSMSDTEESEDEMPFECGQRDPYLTQDEIPGTVINSQRSSRKSSAKQSVLLAAQNLSISRPHDNNKISKNFGPSFLNFGIEEEISGESYDSDCSNEDSEVRDLPSPDILGSFDSINKNINMSDNNVGYDNNSNVLQVSNTNKVRYDHPCVCYHSDKDTALLTSGHGSFNQEHSCFNESGNRNPEKRKKKRQILRDQKKPVISTEKITLNMRSSNFRPRNLLAGGNKNSKENYDEDMNHSKNDSCNLPPFPYISYQNNTITNKQKKRKSDTNIYPLSRSKSLIRGQHHLDGESLHIGNFPQEKYAPVEDAITQKITENSKRGLEFSISKSYRKSPSSIHSINEKSGIPGTQSLYGFETNTNRESLTLSTPTPRFNSMIGITEYERINSHSNIHGNDYHHHNNIKNPKSNNGNLNGRNDNYDNRLESSKTKKTSNEISQYLIPGTTQNRKMHTSVGDTVGVSSSSNGSISVSNVSNNDPVEDITLSISKVPSTQFFLRNILTDTMIESIPLPTDTVDVTENNDR